MTEDLHERKPLVWWQDLVNIHLSLNPSVETAQVTAEQKHMARKICDAPDRGGRLEVQQAQILDEAWLA